MLRQGATLDDERVVDLTTKRASIQETIDEYTEAALTEKQAATKGEHHMKGKSTETLELRERLAVLTNDLSNSDDEELRQAGNLITYGGRGQRGWVAPKTTMTQGGTPRPFENFGQQLLAVRETALQPQHIDPRLKEIQTYQLGLGEAVPSAGGFLVQTDFESDILRRIYETGKLIARPRHIPISGRANSLKINAVDETSRVNGSRLGGVTSAWTAEAATIAKSKPTFRQIELTLHKLASLYYATEEELADTEALEEDVASFVAEELAFKSDDALIRGLGGGEPLGILGHAGTVSVAKEVGQPVNTIVTENLENMFARFWARAPSPIWLVNQNVWPQLFRLEAAVGVGGLPAFLPAGSIAGKPYNTILGQPVMAIEQCESLGTKGDIILADFEGGYVMIDKGGIKAASSIHVEFLTDQEVFRFTLRTDGQPVANAPLTPYKGTETQSSFVTLDDRA